jgi:hypothetical protein
MWRAPNSRLYFVILRTSSLVDEYMGSIALPDSEFFFFRELQNLALPFSADYFIN